MQDSIWFRTLDEGEREPFERCDELPRTAEIVIVGAGMVGLAAAYYLVRCGLRDICVVERGGFSARPVEPMRAACGLRMRASSWARSPR